MTAVAALQAYCTQIARLHDARQHLAASRTRAARARWARQVVAHETACRQARQTAVRAHSHRNNEETAS